MELTHFDEHGNTQMVDVSGKKPTGREAAACGQIRVNREVYDAIIGRKIKKGDVLTVAQVAGIMGAKKTSELIPMCHLLNLTGASVTFDIVEDHPDAYKKAETGASVSVDIAEDTGREYVTDQIAGKEVRRDQQKSKSGCVTLRAVCRVRTEGRTGVEMEALTGVSVALLTVYDMCKAIDKKMVISDIHLLSKSGGRSGDFSFY